MAKTLVTSAVRSLQLELKSLHEEPVEGFRVRLQNDEDLFVWEVAIFGPPDTLYAGGYFKALMKFPNDYPYSPPTVRFLCKMWHPNVYESGDVCISILHPPVDDPQSGELPSERWNPTQSVRTILLSIISLLNEPNTSSPANVDASVMFRRWRESKGANRDYENIVRKQVNLTKLEAEKDKVQVPITLHDYCILSKPRGSVAGDFLADVDFYDDDYMDDDDDNDDYECDDDDDDEGDSGNGDV